MPEATSNIVPRPDRDGSWRRHWIGNNGRPKSRVMAVKNGVVTDMRKHETKPLSWFDDKKGWWEFIQPLGG